jgi:hypothetical protein
MLYRKNVGSAERMARGVGGGLMIACGLLTPMLPQLYARGLIITGLFTIVTGMFGFCPACAAIGRRPVEEPPRAS